MFIEYKYIFSVLILNQIAICNFIFQAKILTRVYHRNLTALVGYCDEDPNLGLVYEYMVNGDLSWHLSGN